MEYDIFDKTLVVRLEPGEDIVSSLLKLAKKEDIKLADVRGLGAVNDAELGLFDIDSKIYHTNEFKNENFEIVSLTGNISEMDGEKYLHTHMAIADKDGHVFGGHLSKGIISATAEIFVSVVNGEIDRKHSEKIGLNLFKFSNGKH